MLILYLPLFTSTNILSKSVSISFKLSISKDTPLL